MLTAFFATVTQSVTSFIGVVTGLFEGLIAIFYDGTAITDVGTLVFAAFGIGLVWFGFRFVLRLVHMRG